MTKVDNSALRPRGQRLDPATAGAPGAPALDRTDRPIRIAYLVTRSQEIGGAQIHVRDMAEAVRHRGGEPMVLAGEDGPLFEQLEARGVPARRIPALERPIRPVREARAFRQIRRVLEEIRPDLLSTHSSKAGVLGRLAARAAGIPVIFTAHGWAFTDGVSPVMGRVYALVERRLAPLAGRLITVSEHDARLAQRHRVGTAGQVAAIHNGMPDVGPEKRADPRKAPPRIVMVGRFSRQKDHATLLRALAEMKERAWSLELVGDGAGQVEVARLAEELGLGGRVRFVGEVEDVAERLGAAQIFVLCSRWEGLPRSIIEAMRAGLPVVASDVGGVSELVAHGDTGFLSARESVVDVMGAVHRLLVEDDLRADMGRKGRLRFEEQFRFERMLEQTLETYRAVVREAWGIARSAG